MLPRITRRSHFVNRKLPMVRAERAVLHFSVVLNFDYQMDFHSGEKVAEFKFPGYAAGILYPFPAFLPNFRVCETAVQVISDREFFADVCNCFGHIFILVIASGSSGCWGH